MGSTSFLSGPKKAKPKQIISVLPNSYILLSDKPAINGVELTKETTLEELNILSASAKAYKTVTLSTAAEQKLSILAISDSGETAKITVDDLLETARTIKTVDEIDENAKIGTYQKVIIKSED